MDWSAWAEQRAQYSRARWGRSERGATIGHCGLISFAAGASGIRERRATAAAVAAEAPDPTSPAVGSEAETAA